MKANDIVIDDIESYLYMERYVNNGSPSGWHKRTTSPETSPFDGADRFPLLQFDVSDINNEVYGKCSLFAGNVNYAHPDSEVSAVLSASKRKPIPSDILVSPTSGARTMLIRNGEHANKGYLKLTYDIARIGRVDRQLTRKHCLACLEASDEIKKAIDDGRITADFGLQLEPAAKISMLIAGDKEYEWGVVYREVAPYPYLNRRVTLIPGFSLFGSDRKNPADPPVILQLIERSGISPEEYLKSLLIKIVDCYWQVVVACGLHMEWHSQNCLFEVDQNYLIHRVILRDLDSVDRDIPLQKFLKVKSLWQCYPVMCFDESIYFYKIRASYMYDFKLGEYLLTPLIDTVCSFYGLQASIFEQAVKTYVREKYLHLLPKDYFPEDGCWYNCDNSERKPGTRREYFPHENPKYR